MFKAIAAILFGLVATAYANPGLQLPNLPIIINPNDLFLKTGFPIQQLPTVQWPVCIFSLSQTYTEFGAPYVFGPLKDTAKAFSDSGVCQEGSFKWTFYGDDFGVPDDHACCLPLPSVAWGNPDPRIECPPVMLIGMDETILSYYFRNGANTNLPLNGYCPDSRTFRWIFNAGANGAILNRCVCATNDVVTRGHHVLD